MLAASRLEQHWSAKQSFSASDVHAPAHRMVVLIRFRCVQNNGFTGRHGIACRCHPMLIVPVLACLVFGVALVATARRRLDQTTRLEKIGGMLLVVGLIGLGFMLASRS